MTLSSLEKQKSIYVNGLSGKKGNIPVDYNALQEKARKFMTPQAFAYVAGGAGGEKTITENSNGFDKWKIVQRMLRDVSKFDLSIELFGKTYPAPLLTAPIGVLELAHPKGDLALARATSSLGTPMIFSSQASYSMEDCAAQMGDSPRWFQLYWSKSNNLVESFVNRAEKCGCEAIVVTLDTTMLGWRTRDLDLGYLPFLFGKGIAQYTSDPIFNQMLELPEDADAVPLKPPINFNTVVSIYKLMKRYPGGLLHNFRSGRPLKAVKQFINNYTRPNLNWEDLPLLRSFTSLPIILKGIVHPEDALKARDLGIDGIIVSNHGGRQVDGAVSSIEMLPEIVNAVGPNFPVLLDSGIRRGSDIFKSLALGANAVCVGRPYVYGLTIDGEHGARTVLENLLYEFELTMRLAGCSQTRLIDRSYLKP